MHLKRLILRNNKSYIVDGRTKLLHMNFCLVYDFKLRGRSL